MSRNGSGESTHIGSTALNFAGFHKAPVPVKYLYRDEPNGEVRIVKPADPEKLAQYLAEKEARTSYRDRPIHVNRQKNVPSQ